MNSFHERIRKHGCAVKDHVKKHHKKYVGGFFAGFAVVKMVLLILGFFVSLNNVSNTFAAQQDPNGLTGTCSWSFGTTTPLVEQQTCHSDNVHLMITRSNPSSLTGSLFCPNELQGCRGVSTNSRSDMIEYTGYFVNDPIGIYNPTCLIGSVSNQVYSGSFYIDNLDKIKPTVSNIGELYTGYECSSITGVIDATDLGCGSGVLYYIRSGVVDTVVWSGTNSGFVVESNNTGTVNLNVSVRDDAKPRCDGQEGGTCGGYNDTTGVIFLEWVDIPLVLTSGNTQDIGMLTGEYVVDDIISLFEAEAGDCETITATVITGSRATCGINGNTLTIYPNPGHNAPGYCQILFSDGDTVQTGTVNFTINVLDCNPDRENNNFLTGRFWTLNPSKYNIICALYGSGPNDETAYTRQWDYNYNCPWTSMKVLYTGSLPTVTDANFIYVLTGVTVGSPSSITMSKCSAIVSNTGSIVKASIDMTNPYVILDGIELQGFDSVQEGVRLLTSNVSINNIAVSHMKKHGIYMSNVAHSVINNTKVYNTRENPDTVGIKIENSNSNTLNNLQVYNHNSWGIYFGGSENNALNNSQIYNNNGGINLENNSKQNYLNNIWYYNNNNALKIVSSDNNVLNKNVFFNNQDDIKTENSSNNIYCDTLIYGVGIADLQAGTLGRCAQYLWEKGNPEKREIQSWDYMTNPVGNGTYLLDWNMNFFSQLIGTKSFGYTTGYSYGVSIAGQEIPLVYLGATPMLWDSTNFAPNYINANHYIGSNLEKTDMTVNVWPTITSGDATVQVTGDGNPSLKLYNVFGNIVDNKYGEIIPYTTGIVLNGGDGPKYVIGQIYDEGWYFASHKQYYPATLDATIPVCDIAYDNTPTSGNVELTIMFVSEQNPSGYSWDGITFTSNGYTSGVSENGTYTGYVVDAAGNTGSCSVTISNIDRQGPTVELTGNIIDSCVIAGIWTITGTFDEYVIGVTQSILSGNNFHIDEFSVVTTGIVYRWKISSIDNNFGTINVFIDTGVVADLAGNQNSSSNELIWNYDSQGPNFTLVETTGVECRLGSWARVIVHMTSDNGCAGTGNTDPYSWDGENWNSNQTFQLSGNHAGILSGIIYVRDAFGNFSTGIGHFEFEDTRPDFTNTGNLTYEGLVEQTTLLYGDLRQEMGVIDGDCGSGTISTGSISCDTGSVVWSGYGIVVTPPSLTQGQVVCTVTFKDDELNEITGSVTYSMNTISSHTVTIVATPTGYGTVSPVSVTENYNSPISISSQTLNIGGTNVIPTPTHPSEYLYTFSGWINNDCGDTLTNDCTITGEFKVECNTNYHWDGSACVSNSNVGTTCPNLTIANAHGVALTYTQTWNTQINDWDPAPAWTYSGSECGFECDTNYHWDGSACVSNSNVGTTCPNLTIEYAHGVALTYTQTWNTQINDWDPAPAWTYSGSECGFECNTNYHWDGSECVSNSNGGTTCPEITIANAHGVALTYTQIWNTQINDWDPAPAWTYSGSECGFECDTNYHWDGSACVSNSNVGTTCPNLTIEHAYGVALTYTQIWNTQINDWDPAPAWTYSGSECGFECDTNYHWDGSECTISSHTVTIVATPEGYGTVNPVSVTKNHNTQISIDSQDLRIGITSVSATPTRSLEYFYIFSGWINNDCGDTLTHDCTITGEFKVECRTNFHWEGSICVSNSNEGVTCPELTIANAYAVRSTYTQTWNEQTNSWDPAPAWTHDGPDCGFECDTDYHWDGSACVSNSNEGVICPELTIANAHAVVGTYTQSWNGIDWNPAPAWVHNGLYCGFECDTNYHWDGSACVSNTMTGDCISPSIPHSVVNIIEVPISWNIQENDWDPAPQCNWRCEPGFVEVGDSCEEFYITITGPGECSINQTIFAYPSVAASMKVLTGLDSADCDSGTFENGGVDYNPSSDLQFDNINYNDKYVCFSATTGGVSVYNGVQLINIDTAGPEVLLDIDDRYYSTGDKNLDWHAATDSGCSHVSGYHYTLYSGAECEGQVITGGNANITGFVFTGENEHSYCLSVYAEDGLGNTGGTVMKSFYIDTNSLGCYILNPEICTSGNVTMTLSGSRTGNDIYLSWSQGEGGIPGVQSITGVFNTGGIVITGYIYEMNGGSVVKTGYCTGEIEMIDREAPTVENGAFTAVVEECMDLTLSGSVIDTGCGSGHIEYQFLDFTSGIISRPGRSRGVSSGLFISGNNLHLSGVYQPIISFSDEVGNTGEVIGEIMVLDTGVTLGAYETGVDLGMLTGNYIGQTGLFEIFHPDEGACDTGWITISTGSCYISGVLAEGVTISLTGLDGQSTGYEINISGQASGTGYCEVLFSDDENNVATGTINFYVDTTYCLQNWDNNHFLTPEFWGMQHNDNQIICALYGSGTQDPETAYTMGWSGYDGTNCSGFDEMDVEWIDSQELTLPLTENTIYVLITTGTQVTDTVNLPECTAIVSSMVDGYDTVVYSNEQLDKMISLTGKYGILDNISVDGYDKYLNGQHTDKNVLGILLSGAENNTFNVVKVYNNNGDGIKVINSELNLLNNIQAYNNVGAGIKLMTGSMYNSLDNVQSYQNSGGGIYFENASRNVLNNISIYGDGMFGYYFSGRSENNLFNNNNIYYITNIIPVYSREFGLGNVKCGSFSMIGVGYAGTTSYYITQNGERISETYRKFYGNTMNLWHDTTYNSINESGENVTIYSGYMETQNIIGDADPTVCNNISSTNDSIVHEPGSYFDPTIKITNPVTENNQYLVPFSLGNAGSSRLLGVVNGWNGKVDKYSYGLNIPLQSRPIIWGGNEWTIGGNVETGYYIGSNVPRASWILLGDDITKVEYVITGDSTSDFVDTFELLQGTIPNWDYVGLQFRGGWNEGVWSEERNYKNTTLTGHIGSGITVYVNTGDANVYYYVPQYYGEHYFATHLDMKSISVQAPYITFSPIATVAVNQKIYDTVDGVKITYKDEQRNGYPVYCVDTSTLSMTGEWHGYYDYMTGFSFTGLTLNNMSLETGTFTGINSNPLLSGNIWNWTVTGLKENDYASLIVQQRVAKDAVEINNTSSGIYYYYDTEGPEITAVSGITVYECEDTTISLTANDACYISGYMFTGFVLKDWTERNPQLNIGDKNEIYISSGDIGRTGETKNLTGSVMDWLGYMTETGIAITIQNVRPILSGKIIDVQLYDQCNYVWSGNLVSKFFAKEGNCGTDDLIATGLVCEGVTGVLNNNDFENFSFVGDSVTGHCEVKIVDNEYINGDAGSYDTGSIDFTRDDDCALLPSCMIDKAAVCTSGEVMLTYSGSDGVVSGSLNNGEIFDYDGHLETIGVSTTGIYKLTVYNSVGLSESCQVNVTTGELDNDNPTIQTGYWTGYECKTGYITVTGNDESCGKDELTYEWVGKGFTGNRFGVYSSGVDSQTINVIVRDGVGHEVSSVVTYSWENVGITLDRSSYSLGDIATEEVIQTGMIGLFGANEGDCGIGDITVTTGQCINATWGENEGKLTIIPASGVSGGSGYCEVIFSDTEGSVETGKINFGANTWQRSCVENWDNDNFLDENFWTGLSTISDIRDTEIICALYGTGEEDKTAYTKGWSGWDYSQCSGRYMDVEFVSILPNNLSGNTIYVLDTDTVELSNSVNMAKCSAIISRSGSTIMSSTMISSGFVYPKKYSILDNLSIKGLNESGYGVDLYYGDNNTINHVSTYSLYYGFLIEYSNNNIINNSVTYANDKGIRTYKSKYNSFNNILSFNNANVGIHINSGSDENIFNNILIYNNVYYGLWFSEKSYYNKINNLVIYNNIHTGLQHDGADKNYYYGDLKFFGNAVDTISSKVSSQYLEIWGKTGKYSTGGAISFDLMVNPVDDSGNYLLGWSDGYDSLRGNKTIGKVVGYSYGSGISTQQQPVAWSGDEIIEVGNAKIDNYIGSNVKKVSGSLDLPGLSSESANITVTGISADELVSYYSVFGNVNQNMIGQSKGIATGVNLSAGEGQKRLVTQLYGDNMFATHFEKSISLDLEITLLEFTGGLGTEECTTEREFTVTGVFNKVLTGVGLSGENVSIEGGCSNENGCSVYEWTVTLSGGVGIVWIETGNIEGFTMGMVPDTIILASYDVGGLSGVTLVIPEQGKIFTGENKIVDLEWSALTPQGCAVVSGYIIWLCTGTSEGALTCDDPIWTGWTNGTGVFTGELDDGTYYRKVQGQNTFGNTGEWSEVRMFAIDNTNPTVDGEGSGLLGGFGDICIGENIFTVTGTFSEAVVGVNISGENVAGLTLVEGFDGSNIYVWTGRLTGGTGKVWIVTGNIRDMNGNSYIGNRPEQIVGNYDNVGPNKVTNMEPNSTIYTTGTTLKWNVSTDSGCAGVSGYNWVLYSGSCAIGEQISGGFMAHDSLSSSYPLFDDLVDQNHYCRIVQPVDNYGNIGETSTGSFDIDASGIGCMIIPAPVCTSGNIVLTLSPKGNWEDIYFSWTGGEFNELNWSTNQITKEYTTDGIVVTGFIYQSGTNKSNNCIYTGGNIDRLGPVIVGGGEDVSVPECTTGIVTIQASDTGCIGGGTPGVQYNWTGIFVNMASYSLYSGGQGSTSVTVQIADNVGNITSKDIMFTWTNSVITANDITVTDKSVNWRTESHASDGACGSETVYFSGFVNDGIHGKCTTGNGDIIIYTPNDEQEYEGSDICIIEVKDDEGSVKEITITFEGIDTEKPICTILYNQECVSGDVTLSMTTSGATQYSWVGFGNTGNDLTKVISSNGTYEGYVRDAAGNTGSCSTLVDNISTGILSAPSNLSPLSGTHEKETPTLSWSGVEINGCRTVSGYQVFIKSGDDTVDSMIVSSITTSRKPDDLPGGVYEWYVQTQDSLGGTNDSYRNTFIIDNSELTCDITYPGQCTSGAITLVLVVNKDLSTNMEALGWTVDIINPHRYTKDVNENTNINFVVQDIYGNTGACIKQVDKFDNIAPIITGIDATGPECSRITGSIVASDPSPECGSLMYSWANGNYENETAYVLTQNGTGSQNITIKVKDSAGNETSKTITYTWTDVPLILDTPSVELNLLTGLKMMENVVSIFGARAGSCETIDMTVTSSGNVSCSLNGGNLTINPYENVEGYGSCIIAFTDGDTVDTGIVDFEIDTKRPTGRGGLLGLTGGLGTAQCTNTDIFTVTGTFSEAVTGVSLAGEHVEIVANNGQGQREYVWTVKLTGGIGKVRIVGDIRDMYGNPLSGTIDELIVGNYDNEGPNKVEQIYPLGGIVPTIDVILQWKPTTDVGCAGDVTYSYILTGNNYENSGTDLLDTSVDISDLENGHRYCRNVIATDRYGNNSVVSNTSCFTVNTGGIQCTITANRNTCGSGPVVLTLAGVGGLDERGEWLSRSNVGNTGNMTKTGSLTKTITGFVDTIGYVQNRWGQTGYCEFTIEQLQDILDLQGSTITGTNYRSGYECQTGMIQMNVSEAGCGISGLKYQWNGVDGLTSHTIYGGKAQVITGIFSAINGAGITTTTGYTYEWVDSPVTATGFTVDLTHGNRVDWKLLSNASDGDCGSDPLTATVSSGSKGTCRVEGNDLFYLPSYTFTGSDSCVLTISDDDGGALSVVINFDNVNPYVQLVSPENNAELDEGNVVFSWIAKDVPLTKQISGYIYQIGTITGFVDTTGVTLNLPTGKYPRSVAIEYADGTAGGHSDLRSVKTVGSLVKDYCPNGDNSDSYYDGVCDNKDIHEVADLCNVMYSNYTNEQKGAYLYAYIKGITTQCPISTANLDGYLRRDEFAKMISVYAINVVGREPNYAKAGCDQFDDIYSDTPELQSYMKLACQLELMGMHANGVTPKSSFDPYSIVTRAEFGTVFSRLLFGDLYNVKDESQVYKQEGYWYKAHLQALKDYGIMTKIDGEWPKYLERRGWAMLMLQRADEYGLFKGKSPALNGISALFS